MTELIWEGKYDKDGHKVAPLRVRLPFQTVETVNESVQQRQRTLDLFSLGRPAEWRNRLIWGDKKYVLPALLEEFAGQVNLIYIDPPFDTGADFSFRVDVNGEDFTKEPSIIEQKAYRDTWGRGLDSYLEWFYEMAMLLRELLTGTGSLYVHLDWRVGHYAKALLDDCFGASNFIQEIVWKHQIMGGAHGRRFPKAHEIILWYGKTEAYKFQHEDPQVRVPFSDYVMQSMQQDEDGRWFYTRRRMSRKATAEEAARKAHTITYVQDPNAGTIASDVWSDMLSYQPIGEEKTGYPTQKTEALLTRLISAGSQPGDLVLDCVAGSGTTAAVSEKLNRRWIACDLSRFAIHTTRKRLLSISGVKPFIVQNLGKYERQLWQSAEFGEHAEQRVRAYRNFILDLYHARLITGYTWLHGVKAGRMVHIGAVDSPVSPGDVTQIAAEFKRAVGTGKGSPATNGVDVLGWDFAFELNEVAKQQAAQANINMRFLRIPREVLEKKAVEQGDIKFFELAALSVDSKQKGRTITLILTDFVIPPDDVPEDVRQTITNWEQWVDYWAVDWNNRDDTFHNEWQDYRTRKKRELQKTISHTYEQPGTYIIMVKVIDILGNDTTKTLKIEVH